MYVALASFSIIVATGAQSQQVHVARCYPKGGAIKSSAATLAYLWEAAPLDSSYVAATLRGEYHMHSLTLLEYLHSLTLRRPA